MKTTNWFLLSTAAIVTLATTVTFANASAYTPGRTPILAGILVGQQGPQDGPPREGGRRRPMPMPVSAATIPVEVMTDYLTLTETQQTKIKDISQSLREQMRPQRPPMDNSGERPAPPTQEEREAQKKKNDAAIQKASDSVTALLTDDQKTKLATLLKAFDALQAGRIPPQALKEMKLTSEQWTKLAGLGKTATRETITSLLTEAQKAALEASRPGPGGGRRGQGGPDGGPGGPGGPDGGPGGPDGGPGGPPPGDF